MYAIDRVRRRRACYRCSRWKASKYAGFCRWRKAPHMCWDANKGANMKTAIIGLGNIGLRAAANLAKGGEHIIISERNLEKARQRAASLGSNAEALPIDEAVKKADVIVL